MCVNPCSGWMECLSQSSLLLSPIYTQPFTVRIVRIGLVWAGLKYLHFYSPEGRICLRRLSKSHYSHPNNACQSHSILLYFLSFCEFWRTKSNFCCSPSFKWLLSWQQQLPEPKQHPAWFKHAHHLIFNGHIFKNVGIALKTKSKHEPCSNVASLKHGLCITKGRSLIKRLVSISKKKYF